MIARWGGALTLALAGLAAPAQAQDTPLRLAAPADCSTNPNCAPGLKRLLRRRHHAHLVKLTDADAGIAALDDGLAEVAVAFSSDPELSRPDIVTLRDDKRMIGPDRRPGRAPARSLDRYGRGLRRRLNAASRAADHARAARAQPAGDRRAAARGRRRRVRRRQRARRRRQAQARPADRRRLPGLHENETLAYLYAEALRAGGYPRHVAPAGGLRKETVAGAADGQDRALPRLLRLAAGVPRRQVAARALSRSSTPSRSRSRERRTATRSR